MSKTYIIECRRPNGSLDFTPPQPESVFGPLAVGIDEDTMAKIVWSKNPDADLHGQNIPAWPAFVDPRWSAREKTW